MLSLKECPSCDVKFRPFYREQIYCDQCRSNSVFEQYAEEDENDISATECPGCGKYDGSETAHTVKQQLCGQCEFHEERSFVREDF